MLLIRSYYSFISISMITLFFLMSRVCAQTISADTIILEQIHIIDVNTGKIKRNRTVEIHSGFITAIKKYKKKNYGNNSLVIEARGRYLIPGLWDMHVHISQGPWYNPEKTFALMIANGITGIREMGGNLNVLKRWKEQVRNGALIGPRMIIAGPILYGDRNIGVTYLAVPSSAAARHIVDSLKSGGVDFIKVYNFIEREQYFAIADEAKKQKLPFAGHVPWSISLIEASDAGQSSIEHLNFPFFAEECAKEATRFRQMDISKIFQFSRPFDRNSIPAFLEQLHYLDSALQQFDQKKADTIYDHFAANHTWQCPTLIYLKTSVNIRDSILKKDPLMKYVYYSRVQHDWDYKNIPVVAGMSELEYRILQRLYEKNLKIVSDMKKKNISFLAGTDLINPFIYPGFSLHQELQLFVERGFTALEALQTATTNPAVFLGLEDSLGSISEGKYADLIMLDANPLKDIHNTQRIEAVIVQGKYYNRKQLDKLLESVAEKK